MLPHTRAMIAAAAFACITREKVAGVHDHATDQDIDIAAEARGDQIKGQDGSRSADFGGMLPEIYDKGDQTFVSLEIDGLTANGYDRGSSSHYVLNVTGQIVQIYDHACSEWFSFSIQTMGAGEANAPQAKA